MAEIYKVLENVQKEIGEVKGAERQNVNESSGNIVEKNSDVMYRIEDFEVKIAEVESKIDDSECFQTVRKREKVKVSASCSVIATSNAFQVLEDEVRDEPSLILVGDSLVRHQDEEFCIKCPRRKHFCYPGKTTEDLTERVDNLIANSS